MTSHPGWDRAGQARPDGWREVLCPGKLNLFLEVGARRADGYHEVETVMAPLRLADQLWFRPRAEPLLELVTTWAARFDPAELPSARENLVYRVLEGFQRAAGVKVGAEVRLCKAVPVQAGLGGASSDAAAALLVANRDWQVGWSLPDLSDFAATFGSDIPFFLAGGWAVCRGRGERVTPIAGGFSCPVVLVRPPVGFPTAEVYRRHRWTGEIRGAESLIAAIQGGRTREVGRQLFNRLEVAAAGFGSWVRRMQGAFRDLPAIGRQMTGSGSCYFGMFPNAPVARSAARRLKARLPDCRVILSELLPG